MDHDAVRASLEAQILNNFPAAQPGVTMTFANTRYTTPTTPWIHVAVIPNLDRRANLGDFAQFKLMGVVNVACMVPENTGTGQVTRIADSVATLLVDRTISVPPVGSVKCCNASRRDRGVVNGWYTVNILVEYHAHVRVDRS